jgi:iron complex transport system permease protein
LTIAENKATIILAVITLILSGISLFIGVVHLDMRGILAGDFKQVGILLISRLPRLLAILCAGVGMSVAGLIMQQLCMNKFVSPSTSATISSSQFGILLAMLFLPGATLLDKTLFSFGAAVIGTWIFVLFIQKVKFKDVVMVPLTGIMFGSIISGITEYFAYKYEMKQALASWLVGDFSLIIRGRYEIVFLSLPLVVTALVYANHFNIVGMGEHFAKNLGVRYSLVLFTGLSIAALITASVVVTVGTIPYIGLIVPNLVSLFKGDHIRGTLIDTALSGALFVLVCDVAGRLVIFPYEMPVNLIVGILGSVIFIGLLFRRLNPEKKRCAVSPVKPRPAGGVA